jgi:hypothetical protein
MTKETTATIQAYVRGSKTNPFRAEALLVDGGAPGSWLDFEILQESLTKGECDRILNGDTFEAKIVAKIVPGTIKFKE